MNSLVVAEQFYSIQGEGRTTGIPAFFLRLAGCNLMCGGRGTDIDKKLHDGATWRCDTIEVWKKGRAKTFRDILDDFAKIDDRGMGIIHQLMDEQFAHLVITGGEPMINQERVADFIEWMIDVINLHPVVEIETNGTVKPGSRLHDGLVAYYNVSPKLKNSGEAEAIRKNTAAMRALSNDDRAIFKFVVATKEDIDEVIDEWIKPFQIPPASCYLMPAADNEKTLREVSQFVAEQCKMEGFRFSSRLHLAIWDQKTGV